MLFFGKYEYTIDAQHRLAIPAKIRAGLDPEADGESFIATKGSNGAIWLWTERTFQRMAGHIEASLVPAPELTDFDEITFPDAEHLEMDSAGRIRLPEAMIADGRLGSKVLIVGMRNHLELWDHERWETRHRDMASRRDEIVQRARPLLDRPRRGDDGASG